MQGKRQLWLELTLSQHCHGCICLWYTCGIASLCKESSFTGPIPCPLYAFNELTCDACSKGSACPPIELHSVCCSQEASQQFLSA